MTTATAVTAVITGRGARSTVPDNPGAVDALINVGGALVGHVTLLPNHEGELVTWGDLDNWANFALQEWLPADPGERDDVIGDILVAVNTEAAKS